VRDTQLFVQVKLNMHCDLGPRWCCFRGMEKKEDIISDSF